ncbi:MAG TPA: hypothetical protein VGN98_05255, partial [Tianweitania sediminis]|nr:hypothetical protein [Tianweitania sediminis]
AEQKRLQTLRDSRSAADQRALGDLLTEGLIASPDNPLRRPDRIGAIAAYRAARAAGDRSEATLVRLVKLLLSRLDDTRTERHLLALRELEGELRAAVFKGSGDAAYVLALAAELNVLGTPDEKERLLQSAIVLGNVSAILESARSAVLGETVQSVALAKLQARAVSGAVDAMIALARLHGGNGLMAADRSKARAWLEKAVSTTSTEAKVELASHLLDETDVAGFERAHLLLSQAAEQGSRQAALLLGIDAATSGRMQISAAEGRLWLARALSIGERAAAPHLVALDLRGALAASLPAKERETRLQSALAPVAEDPEALTALASRPWAPRDAALIEPVLLPMLHKATLGGDVTAGLAYDSWLRASGLPIPDDAASALVGSLRRSIAANVGYATFALADLALDDRLPVAEISREEAVAFLFRAADAHVGQAMLRIAQMYAYGDGFAQSDAFATRWYRLAAGNRVEAAAWELAELQGRSRDPAARKEATTFFNARLNEGEARAGTALVRMQLAAGALDPRTLLRAEQAASLPEDRYELVKALVMEGSAKSFDAARRILAPAVKQASDPVALVLEARMQLAAGNSAGDPRRGMALLQRAAALGAVEAKLALASLYLTRMRFREHQGEAVALLHEVLASRPKSTPARLLLSDAYLRGHGVSRDAEKAAKLVKQVLAENSADPQASLLEADW